MSSATDTAAQEDIEKEEQTSASSVQITPEKHPSSQGTNVVEDDVNDCTCSVSSEIDASSAQSKKQSDLVKVKTSGDAEMSQSDNESDSEEEEEEEDSPSSILTPSMIMKCFVVAVIASSYSVMQLNDNSVGKRGGINERRNQDLDQVMYTDLTRSEVSSRRFSKRASNLDFCRNTTKIYSEDDCLSSSSEPSLTLMDFNMQNHLMDFVVDNYELEYFPESRMKSDPDDSTDVLKSSNSTVKSLNGRQRYHKARALVHIDPLVSSYYQLAGDDEDYGKAVVPSFTGFAGKFINLSPLPVLFYWDGPEPRLLDKIMPFEAVGTATFPAHQFYFTPEYDSSHVLKRFFITSDTKVMVYDSEPELSSLKPDHRKKYLSQLANLEYARDYLVTTKRHWLAMFPRPLPKHHMWRADYFFQEHTITTRETHFIKPPSDKELSPIYFDGEYGVSSSTRPRPLSKYRIPADVLNLTLKVCSWLFKISYIITFSHVPYNLFDRSLVLPREFLKSITFFLILRSTIYCHLQLG